MEVRSSCIIFLSLRHIYQTTMVLEFLLGLTLTHAGPCPERPLLELHRNPTERELRCEYGVAGPGRFGLLSYVDVPVYQPATPMPGTHIIGIPGHAHPMLGESYEEWEWRVLRTEYGALARETHRSLDLLDPEVAPRVRELEERLTAAGIPFTRLETWRSPRRQAFLFQQGRSRPGPLATATLTSWHSHVDASGRPAGRAVDYAVRSSLLPAFHRIVAAVGLSGFGAESFDPGHVFLPEHLPTRQIALLRILPRVPEVTLATGLPVDRPLPEGGRTRLREITTAFTATPFVPAPRARLAGTEPDFPLILQTLDWKRPASSPGLRAAR
jgi:hypothetical protein